MQAECTTHTPTWTHEHQNVLETSMPLFQAQLDVLVSLKQVSVAA